MSSAHNEVKTEDAKLLDEMSSRVLNGEPVDLTKIAASHPEMVAQLRELESTVKELAAWGNQQLHSGEQSGDIATINRVLGDFQILREIGRGGMGIVYHAKQLSLDREVALKVLPFAALLDERNLRRFQTEARAAAILNHDGIVSVYSVGCERGVHYYAMQWINMETLHRRGMCWGLCGT